MSPLPEVQSWIVPPECQGQIVEVAYGSQCDGTYYRRTSDRSDGSVTYAVADASDCGCDRECECFDPTNREPKAFVWTEVSS